VEGQLLYLVILGTRWSKERVDNMNEPMASASVAM
jgi:hypothetical protein